MPTTTQRRAVAQPASRYDRGWSTVALAAAGTWVAVAVLQTARLPLVLLVLPLAALGGLLFVRAAARSDQAPRQYAGGVLRVATVVLVLVGIGHHPALGAATVAVLAASSPTLLRWVQGPA